MFRSKLPEFHQFFSIHNAFLLAVVLGVTKVMHEFGHGLSCKHFGGECHEMGVMILVLTPCLYCNVSDSWMLPSKWHRAAIGAAGIYVEVVLASICTFLWWFSEPGLFHNLCLNVMFISSVSTIIFNANPLLRYDGYYILADLMEIPNLRQKATHDPQPQAGRVVPGHGTARRPLPAAAEPDVLRPVLGRRRGLSLGGGVFDLLVPLQTVPVVRSEDHRPGRGADVAVGVVRHAALSSGQVLLRAREDRTSEEAAISTPAWACWRPCCWRCSFVPLPHSVICTLEIQARDAQPVYVDVAGKLVSLDVKPGQQVAAGQQLAQLRSIDIDLEIAKLEGSVNEYQHAAREPDAAERSRSAAPPPRFRRSKRRSKTVEDQLKEKTRDQERLRLVAPAAGTVLPPPLTPRREDADEKLPTWSGTPLGSARTSARYLEPGVLFCQVGDPKRLEAVLVVDQADRNLIREGQSVDIKLEGFPSTTLHSKIAEIAESELKVTPAAALDQVGRRTAHQDRSAHRRREADEHVVPGPRADRRSRRD